MTVNQMGRGVETGVSSIRQYTLSPECKYHEHTSTYLERRAEDPAAKRLRLQQQRDSILRDTPMGDFRNFTVGKAKLNIVRRAANDS